MGKIKKIILSFILVFATFNFAYADYSVSPGAYSSPTNPDRAYTSEIFSGSCNNIDESQALTCWMEAAWLWTQRAILILSVAALIFAGTMYMTSAGNPKRVEYAKKVIWGAISAVIVVVLGKFFLTKVVGVPWPWI